MGGYSVALARADLFIERLRQLRKDPDNETLLAGMDKLVGEFVGDQDDEMDVDQGNDDLPAQIGQVQVNPDDEAR